MAMPAGLNRIEDALEAAAEMWQDANTKRDQEFTLTYYSVRVIVSYCPHHEVIELELWSPEGPIGLQAVHSADDIARVIDAVICVEMLCKNLADRYVLNITESA